MKSLKRMLLIHWHYFAHEMIEFDGINFLTGKNSSGKSTIIDAMQLVLLGDTSGAYFNKAASGRGNRTLMGYLRCELGDDENAGFRYLRNGRFTSYIVLEFQDSIKGSTFSAGCCFDFFGENDYQRLFFRFDDAIPENEFMENGIPSSIDRLRAFIRENYPAGQSYTTNVNRDFREALCGSLGGLQPGRFSDLLKKAVSFNPNVDIRQFITEFVCGDEQEINIADMKENIRSYDTLKEESRLLKARIELLAEIIGAYDEYARNKDNETLYSYLVRRAEWEIKEEEIKKCRRHALRLEKLIEEMNDKRAGAESGQKQLQAERDGLKLQLDSNENARRLEELKKEIEEKRRSHIERKDEFEKLHASLHRALSSWKSFISGIGDRMRGIDLAFVDPLLRERIEALFAEGENLLEQAGALRCSDADGIIEAGSDNLIAMDREAGAYRDRCANLHYRLHEAQTETARHKAELEKEKKSLEEGKYRFPQDAIDLKEAIESRLRSKFGPDARAFILAEAMEIRNDRWRNAIEGYLHTQKFYVIVAPEHFYTAFQLYDSIKRQKTVYSTGLVDTEKLARMDPAMDDGSLAEELETENPAARLFINFTLGRVRKCDSIRDLRRQRTSITDDGVLYQNFVVRAIDPKRWASPAIGRSGAKLRLEKVVDEIARLYQELSVYAALIPSLQDVDSLLRVSGFEAEQMISSAKQYLELPELRKAIERLAADAESIEKSEVGPLRDRLEEREAALREIAEHIREIDVKTGTVENELGTCREETLPKLENEESELRNDIEAKYDENWAEEVGGPRYQREYSARGSAEEIAKAFPRELARSRNAKEEAWTHTRDRRFRYNETYRIGYNIDSPDNDGYQKAWTEYAENKLPEYEGKIEDTRQKAFQQFQEDFLSKLQDNIRNARAHVDELNASMRSASFGEDTYQFRVAANPENKRFHDMIVDEMLLFGGYNLLSEQYNAKYREEMAELFELITNDGSTQTSHGYEDYEKRVAYYTDYKSYLLFDLEVSKPNGETERLSRTMGKKSGGETQTPFYIAVLASFVQLYRVGRDKVPNTARLIIFDEAFSKMDGERIIQSIGLLRRFQFQVVFAAPPDKVPDIATLADRNLWVWREGQKTRVQSFDPKSLEDLADGD